MVSEVMSWFPMTQEMKYHFHSIRKVTLVDGSCVDIDLVTGITRHLDEQLKKTDELEQKYRQKLEEEEKLMTKKDKNGKYPIPLLSVEETKEFIKEYCHPTRKVTLGDGSCVYIDRVTGITCDLDEQLKKKEELEEKYRQRVDQGLFY